MTKKQRAQVVELLRCAHEARGIGNAAEFLGLYRGPAWGAAINAWEATADAITEARGNLAGVTYEDVCLEAAASVEEGSWPGADQ